MQFNALAEFNLLVSKHGIGTKWCTIFSSSPEALATLWLRFLQATAKQHSNVGVAPRHRAAAPINFALLRYHLANTTKTACALQWLQRDLNKFSPCVYYSKRHVTRHAALSARRFNSTFRSQRLIALCATIFSVVQFYGSVFCWCFAVVLATSPCNTTTHTVEQSFHQVAELRWILTGGRKAFWGGH